ncbi:MAG: efflux RND transporter periplasmic adaptor subunit [Proteobacteria bacterium]|nr:efflux RND transporter periplasmic adaptor subunit [Pseudomonadota bacterium]
MTLAASLLVAAVGACHGSSTGRPPGGATPVTVVTLKSGPVELTRELPGRTAAFLVSEVRPQATGIVKARLFSEGASVKAGQALYQLDDSLYRAQFESSRAAVAKAEAALEVARLAAGRANELVKTHAISAQDHDTAVAAERQAAADLEATRAALETSRVNLAYTRITAPISGRIGKSAVTPGALVLANQATPLATVQQLDPMYVEVSQSSTEWLALKQEIDAGHLQPRGAGSKVGIVLEDGRRYPQEGRLEFADVTVDSGTGSFILRAVVPNPSDTLLPGMYVRAVLHEAVRPDGLLVPQVAVTRDPKGGTTALVVGAGDQVELRPVVVSRTLGDRWLVESGLKPGERVVVEGLQKVRPGDHVAPTEAGTAPAQ